jgi:hypothetical protein
MPPIRPAQNVKGTVTSKANETNSNFPASAATELISAQPPGIAFHMTTAAMTAPET